MIDGVSNALEFVLLVGAAGALVAGWIKKVKPRLREREQDRIAQRDVLLGRPPIYDTIIPTKEIAPALPGIGQRMAEQESLSSRQAEQLAEMTRALTTLAESHKHQLVQDARLDAHEREIGDHGDRLSKLENAAVERVVARAESAAAWRAMEAAHLAEAPLDVEADES